jgi:hypothetical protein
LPTHVAQKIIDETKKEREAAKALGLSRFSLSTLLLLRGRSFLVAQVLDHVGDVRELLLEVAPIVLQPFE